MIQFQLEKNLLHTSTLAIKRLTQMIEQRSDLFKTLLPVRDGIFLIMKIEDEGLAFS